MGSDLWSWSHGLWSAAHGLWLVISNVWSVAGGLWSLGYCPYSVDSALLSVVYCLCFLAYWPWPMAPGPWVMAVDHIPHSLCFAARNLLIAADPAWSMVHYALRMLYGLSSTVNGPQFMVHGPWFTMVQVHGPRAHGPGPAQKVLALGPKGLP